MGLGTLFKGIPRTHFPGVWITKPPLNSQIPTFSKHKHVAYQIMRNFMQISKNITTRGQKLKKSQKAMTDFDQTFFSEKYHCCLSCMDNIITYNGLYRGLFFKFFSFISFNKVIINPIKFFKNIKKI